MIDDTTKGTALCWLDSLDLAITRMKAYLQSPDLDEEKKNLCRKSIEDARRQLRRLEKTLKLGM